MGSFLKGNANAVSLHEQPSHLSMVGDYREMHEPCCEGWGSVGWGWGRNSGTGLETDNFSFNQPFGVSLPRALPS